MVESLSSFSQTTLWPGAQIQSPQVSAEQTVIDYPVVLFAALIDIEPSTDSQFGLATDAVLAVPVKERPRRSPSTVASDVVSIQTVLGWVPAALPPIPLEGFAAWNGLEVPIWNTEVGQQVSKRPPGAGPT